MQDDSFRAFKRDDLAALKKQNDLHLEELWLDPLYRRKSWSVAIACFLFYVCACGSLNTMTPILSSVLYEFSETTTYGATLSSLFVAVNAICALPVGLLISKYGFRKIGYIGFAFLFLGTLYGAVFVDSSESMLLGRILQGIGYTVPCVLDTAIIVQWFPAKRLGLPLGILGGASGLSSSLMHWAANAVMPYFGWRGLWWVLLLLIVFSFSLFCFCAKPGPGERLVSMEKHAEKSEKVKIVEVLKVPEIWACCIVFFSLSVILKGFMPFTNLIFVDNCGVDNATASNMSALFSFGLMFSGLVGGLIYDKAGKGKGVIFSVVTAIWVIGMVWGFTLADQLSAWCFCLIFGLLRVDRTFVGCVLPAFSPSPGVLSVALSLYIFIGQFMGGILGPYIMDYAQLLGGSWRACGVAVGVFGAVAVVSTAFLAHRLRKREIAAKKVAEVLTRS